MKFELYIAVEEKDKNGQLKYFSRRKANSLVLNFIDLLSIQMSQVAQNLTDFGGTSRAVAAASVVFRATAGAGTITNGIRVGTGTNAVAVTDTTLQTAITHGTGAGQLSHGANSVGAPVTSGTSRQFTISRTFTNNTASAITVNEIGLVGDGAGSAYNFLIDRTLNSFTINAAASKTVTYTIRITV